MNKRSVNNWDVLKTMSARNMDIGLAPLSNVEGATYNKSKGGTLVRIGFPGNIIDKIARGVYLGGLLLADADQYEQVRLELEARSGPRALPIWEEALTLARDRAAQAERERDEARKEASFVVYYERRKDEECERADKLQADLDAALVVISEANGHSAVRIQDRMCSEEGVAAWKRVEPLLEKRRENRGK